VSKTLSAKEDIHMPKCLAVCIILICVFPILGRGVSQVYSKCMT